MYQIRIKDGNIYPYDMEIEKYFKNDDFTDCYDTKEKAVKFVKMLNNNGIKAYLYEF